eukprot:TRINITY_DN3397_c0_g1_i13.p1 TRINITY_DN3397_c0_g1~~TRINITY_DN3397_c0_g1_i13.p1  ORF type:complete len:1108 (+),score=359.62 TRINITY_DN3397_c0_g1_i13:207-3326(+)
MEDLSLQFMIVQIGDKPLSHPDLLPRVVALDEYLRTVDGYEQHCRRDWSDADYDIQNDSDKVAETKVLNENYLTHVPCLAPVSPLWGCSSGDAINGCSAIESFPGGIRNCKKDSCTKTEDFEEFDYTFAKMKIDQYSAAGVPADAEGGRAGTYQFYATTDHRFDDTNSDIHSILMKYEFGLPQPGYNTVLDDQTTQEEELIDWLFDEYSDFMLDHEDDDFKFLVFSSHLQNKFIEEQLNADTMWIMGAFFFAWTYLVSMIGSFWLGTMGIGQVFMCFFSSYNIYAVILQQDYVGTFNVLAIFIILGIGADNVFVFIDTFSYSGSVPVHNKTMESRLLYTWKRAALQLLITGAVAALTFFVQYLTSSFPAISTFGAFSACLVFMNYMSVILFYPTCVMVYEKKFRDKPFMFGVFGIFSKKKNENTTESEDENGKSDLTALQSFFQNMWFPFIMKARYIIIIACVLVIAVGVFKASELESDPEPPKFFDEDHKYEQMSTVIMEEFSRGGSEMALVAHVVSGFIKDEPIDRSGIEPTDREDRGIPNYDPNFSAAKTASCMIQLCDFFEVKNDYYAIGGSDNMYSVTCPVRAFRDHVVSTYDQAMWDSMVGADGNEDLFIEKGIEWFQEPSVYDEYKMYVFADAHQTDERKFGSWNMLDIGMKLTFTSMAPYEDGIEYYERWDTLLDDIIFDGSDASFSECPAVKSSFQPYVTDGEYTWDFFYLQEAMVEEAWLGIAYAIGIVFIVMLVSTQNIIVTIIGTALIGSVVVCVIGFTVLNGWYLGLLESINFVIVPGFSINYVAFLCGGYLDSKSEKRADRVRDMLTSIGSSCISGSLSTLGACFFLFFPVIVFFSKFGTFIFVTITLSLTFSLGLFASVMTFVGPEGNQGDIMALFNKSKKDELPVTQKDSNDANRKDSVDDQDDESTIKESNSMTSASGNQGDIMALFNKSKKDELPVTQKDSNDANRKDSVDGKDKFSHVGTASSKSSTNKTIDDQDDESTIKESNLMTSASASIEVEELSSTSISNDINSQPNSETKHAVV